MASIPTKRTPSFDRSLSCHQFGRSCNGIAISFGNSGRPFIEVAGGIDNFPIPRFVNVEALGGEEQNQVEFEKFGRDPYARGLKFSATDTYRTANLTYVIDAEQRKRQLM